MQPLEFRSKQCIHTAHTKVSPEIITIHKFYIIEFNMNYYYKPSSNSCINKYFQSLIVQRKINDSSDDDTRYHDEARTWHHSALSSLAWNISYSTNQPEGRVHGQVKLATMSSKVSHENKATSNIFWLSVVFAKKYLRVSPYFQVLASSSSWLTILGKQLSKSHIVEK
jgi:hypothetical protein